MREIAMRGFINEKFNTTFGKGLFRRAIFNGSIELRNPYTKFLVDFYAYPEWEALAKSDDQMAVIHQLYESNISTTSGLVLSWLLHYDPMTKTKTAVKGYAIYSQDTKEIYIRIDAPNFGVADDWTLTVSHCKITGANKPVFIAANIDLATWQ